MLATLLPDSDFVWRLFRKGDTDSTHRDLLHYPLLFTPVVFAVGLTIGMEVALVLALGSLLHFIHDSFGVGFGVKWLHPFKKNSYMFLYRASTPSNKDMPKKLIYSWTDDERRIAIKKYGYPGWIRHIYFRIHPFGLLEYAVFALGVYVAIASYVA